MPDGFLEKRCLKRIRLESVVAEVEKEKHKKEATGSIFLGTPKATLIKRAGVSKNYIDGLEEIDPLAKRIALLLRRPKAVAANQDLEAIRLERIAKLRSKSKPRQRNLRA